MSTVVTLGEVLFRLSSTNGKRLADSEIFQRFIGGAEVNVAVSLANYGHEVRVYTGVPSHETGQAVKTFLKTNDVDTRFIVDCGDRVGIYYHEPGYSVRGANVIYDRKGTSFLDFVKLEHDWESVFSEVDGLHVSGITPALNEEALSFMLSALKEANNRGITISFDCNFRSKLWNASDASHAFKKILPFVDICFAGYKDFLYLLGYKGVSEDFNEHDLMSCYEKAEREFNISIFASTNRKIHSEEEQELKGYYYQDGKFYTTDHQAFHVLDRIGGGDAFAAGILHGIFKKVEPTDIINFGLAAAVLKHTVKGDHNQFAESEVYSWIEKRGRDVSR
ncbi:sugar kinase [Halobacillus sp. Nhm2S1]|uniref:sugar kinase n=1 Tax=Halobacillus sp. Nhm2S1 TaxID=2866716 RepID=UPI001C73CEEA|nr:sugar kinase [Halobacillus sp. Nhm2S1]MBX0356835.1 sugar kinase [Halobacillus sp. Nhm2S1]